jgi:hypothetical protein
VGEGRAETEEREGALSNQSLNTNALLICLTILSTLYGNTIRSPSLVGEAEVESLAPVVLCSGKVCECQESNSVAGSSASSAKSEQKTHIRACLPSKERPISSPFARCAICSRSPRPDLFVARPAFSSGRCSRRGQPYSQITMRLRAVIPRRIEFPFL